MKRKIHSLTLGGKLIEIKRPLVMGIVNVTPDSFYAASRTESVASALGKVEQMLADGADIIDIGGCSTRPGAPEVSVAEEWNRLEPALDSIRSRFPDILISIDTFRPEIAGRAIDEFGAQIINDVSIGGDPEMKHVIADRKAGYVMMHTKGTPRTMEGMAEYEDVTAEVLSELAFKINEYREAGIANIIIDPGFGFAKTLDGNYRLLAGLKAFGVLDAPLLVGVSRKSMITKVLGCTPDDALAGTIALNAAALLGGADILRVHDVKVAADTVKIISKLCYLSE